MKTKPNSFTVVTYILMFLIVLLCLGLIIWAAVVANRKNNELPSQPKITTYPVTMQTATEPGPDITDPCVQSITQGVVRLWSQRPDLIPHSYLNLMTKYADEEVMFEIHGMCNSTTFICEPGEILSDCDPCAVPMARQMAMEQQISDMVSRYCK